MKQEFSKTENILSTEPIVKKLKIMDYVFWYKGSDLKDAQLKYCFDKMYFVKYEDGKRKKEEFRPTIAFSISACDENDKQYSFSFLLDIDLDKLNKFTNKPSNINEFIIQGETFFWDDNSLAQSMDCDLEESIYHFTPSFLVQKLEDKKYAFKIQFQDLFIWFHVDFS